MEKKFWIGLGLIFAVIVAYAIINDLFDSETGQVVKEYNFSVLIENESTPIDFEQEEIIDVEEEVYKKKMTPLENYHQNLGSGILQVNYDFERDRIFGELNALENDSLCNISINIRLYNSTNEFRISIFNQEKMFQNEFTNFSFSTEDYFFSEWSVHPFWYKC